MILLCHSVINFPNSFVKTRQIIQSLYGWELTNTQTHCQTASVFLILVRIKGRLNTAARWDSKGNFNLFFHLVVTYRHTASIKRNMRYVDSMSIHAWVHLSICPSAV
jgi:hypothetical protein